MDKTFMLHRLHTACAVHMGNIHKQLGINRELIYPIRDAILMYALQDFWFNVCVFECYGEEKNLQQQQKDKK